MNYSDHTERVHTFADVPRLSITRWQITAQDKWDAENKSTVQIGFEPDVVPSAVVAFLANLHDSPYRSSSDIELLKRFAGAMGLHYPHEPGLSK